MIVADVWGTMMMGSMTKLNMSRKINRLSITRKRKKEKYDRIPVPNIPVKKQDNGEEVRAKRAKTQQILSEFLYCKNFRGFPHPLSGGCLPSTTAKSLATLQQLLSATSHIHDCFASTVSSCSNLHSFSNV